MASDFDRQLKLSRRRSPIDPAASGSFMGDGLVRSTAPVARYAFGWLFIVGVVILFGWLRGCWPFAGHNQPRSAEPVKTSAAEWLDYCSPFETLNGQQALTFASADRTVIAAEAPAEEKEKGAFAATHAQERKGDWVADEETRRVSVEIEGVKSEYTLLIPFGEDQCILVSGALGSADLNSSLFAIPHFPEPEPDP